MLDRKVYEAMLSFISNQHILEKNAAEKDFFFLQDHSWLDDTAVIDRIEYRKRAWEISLIFAHYKKPLQLLFRKIVTSYSEQKAETASFYLRRQAAKDRRGTLEITLKDLNLCIN